MSWPPIARASIAIAALAYASWSDLRSREVSDVVWIALVVAAAPMVALEAYTGHLPLHLLLGSIAVSLALGAIIYLLGLFGGADAKALWCLGVALPTPPPSPARPMPVSPIFTLSVFDNTVALAALTSIYALIRNLAYWARGGRLFEGLSEPLHRRALAMLIGYKVDPSRVREGGFYFLMEEVVEGRRRLKLGALLRAAKAEEFVREGLSGEVWATPALPMIVYMLAGLVVALTVGDLVMSLSAYVLSSALSTST
ncbi:hypothetical protein B6U99_07185 [Candidatus Geothermarchaeota archaeon ex4572_27]|nr:MAG: hypothetical protein B6U99_07185 [Candidatus Geothermarchaeota archaeon ex4572_27]